MNNPLIGRLVQVFASICFVIDALLHLSGKTTDANAAYQVACDIFIFLLGYTWDKD